MSNVDMPDGWTEEQWQDYFESAYDSSDGDVKFVTMDVVDVPDIQAEPDQAGTT